MPTYTPNPTFPVTYGVDINTGGVVTVSDEEWIASSIRVRGEDEGGWWDNVAGGSVSILSIQAGASLGQVDIYDSGQVNWNGGEVASPIRFFSGVTAFNTRPTLSITGKAASSWTFDGVAMTGYPFAFADIPIGGIGQSIVAEPGHYGRRIPITGEFDSGLVEFEIQAHTPEFLMLLTLA